MTSTDDEVQFLLNTPRLSQDVPSVLASHGWTCVTSEARNDETIEWIWPPTAPVGYAGQPEWTDPGVRVRPHFDVPRVSPWTAPTRLLQHANATWELQYGAAHAQPADESRRYSDHTELLADLERFESWPMSLEEWRRLSQERLWVTTVAAAENTHYLSMTITEPYGSRFDAISASEITVRDEQAQWRLVDAEAWTSAVRTARAGGPDWGPNGPADAN